MRSHRLFRELSTDEHLEEALATSQTEPVVIFKHSAICMTSTRALARIESVANNVAAVYKLVVQESRALSNRVARRFSIRHESPQIIVLSGGKPVFDASHGRITAESVASVVDVHRTVRS